MDEDATVGGASVAYQIRHNPAYPKQPNNEDTLKAAAAHGIPMDFFSYHSITSSPGSDHVEVCLRDSCSDNPLGLPVFALTITQQSLRTSLALLLALKYSLRMASPDHIKIS